jgi:hypothetical protein
VPLAELQVRRPNSDCRSACNSMCHTAPVMTTTWGTAYIPLHSGFTVRTPRTSTITHLARKLQHDTYPASWICGPPSSSAAQWTALLTAPCLRFLCIAVGPDRFSLCELSLHSQVRGVAELQRVLVRQPLRPLRRHCQPARVRFRLPRFAARSPS